MIRVALLSVGILSTTLALPLIQRTAVLHHPAVPEHGPQMANAAALPRLDGTHTSRHARSVSAPVDRALMEHPRVVDPVDFPTSVASRIYMRASATDKNLRDNLAMLNSNPVLIFGMQRNTPST